MRMHRSRIHTLALACMLAVACLQAGATGLQVAPTTLTLAAARSADGLWLSNTGAEALHAQVRVYAWTQEGGEDHLAPSRALAISPPMLQLEPGARQLVRVIRVGAPPIGNEQAFRLIVDELPLDVPAPATEAKPGSATALKFTLRYSVPIFVAPATPTAADLEAHVISGDVPALEVRNAGSQHSQLAGLSLVVQGQREDLVPGLLGYVLPGQTMRWPLKISAAAFARGGNLHAKVNGEMTEHVLAPIKPAP